MTKPTRLALYSYLVVTLLNCLSCTSSSALAQDERSRNEQSRQTWSKSTYGFGASLVFTNNPERFFAEWDTPSDHAPRLHIISAARRGTTATGLIIFSGCKADQQGNCDANVSFNVFRPDGAIYASLPNAELWKDKSSLAQGALQIGVAYLVFRIEHDDALGDYLVEAIVRDKVAEIELLLTQVIHVLPVESIP